MVGTVVETRHLSSVALKDLALRVVALPIGQRQWLQGEVRRQVRAVRLGRKVKRAPRRLGVRISSRDARTSFAVRERDGWKCRLLLPGICAGRGGIVFPKPGNGDLDPGETSGLQNCHVIPRRYKRTRYLVLNGLSGCAPCHHYYTNHPREWEAFCRTTLGDDVYEQLRRVAGA